MSAGEAFGTLASGETVRRMKLSGGGLTASILSFGAIIQDLRIDGHDAPLVLGYERLEDYLANINYFGAVAGRNANRLRDGRFSIDGREYRVDGPPEAQGLHGGALTYARRDWSVVETAPDRVVLALRDPDGMMGFPGTLDVRCAYEVSGQGVFSVEFTATTDRPTLCNPTQHVYFNLDDGGASPILDHVLEIDADAYLPTDSTLIPTGEIRPVAGTPHDLRAPRRIAFEHAGGQLLRYDSNFCLARQRRPLTRAARATGARSGVGMEVWTTEPGLQFYAGHYILPSDAGLGGRAYAPFSGFCLEAQVWPDAPNHDDFPQAVLRPGEIYRQRTEFRFHRSRSGAGLPDRRRGG
jgi:aldose 1-epimerase